MQDFKTKELGEYFMEGVGGLAERFIQTNPMTLSRYMYAE
jgi:hypothetical protein